MKNISRKKNTSISTEIRGPLDGIDLSGKVITELLLETVGETALEALSPRIGKILNFTKTFEGKINEARTSILLRDFESKHESHEKFQESIKNLITNPAGIILFQKVVRIVNADILDEKYIKILAGVLKKISNSDFHVLFEEHNYVLSQIEKLSPQALLVLSDFSNWPSVSYSSTTTSGVTSGEGWDTSFATLYSNRKETPDEKTRARLSHVVNELRNNNLMIPERTTLPLTTIGEEVYKYLR